MYTRCFLSLLLSVFIIPSAMSQNTSARIRHTVVFTLKHEKDSPEEADFINDIKNLAAIPGVEKFEFMKQISKKNNYDYGLSMEFADQKAYDAYNQHPDHVAFVQNRWLKEVKEFMEIDFAIE
ncbi:MAG TPA: Dabb family protein [Bacteroidales bacterium]|nr:Dabb family protein [Bacteroidales bacterium]